MTKSTTTRGVILVVFCVSFLWACGGNTSSGDSTHVPAAGLLRVAVIDADTGVEIPARVELIDESGGWRVPANAVPVVGDCGRQLAPEWWALGVPVSDGHPGITDPATGAVQLYTGGLIEAPLPAGRYLLTVRKGMEYRESSVSVEVRSGRVTEIDLVMSRWIDLPARGWYSADDHLHITRTAKADFAIATWMQAEDLHVASLLQMGTANGVHAAPQSVFGAPGVRQEGGTVVVSGQENPRTWFLGHAIVLGVPDYLDRPESYLIYEDLFSEARSVGGLIGYAHFGALGMAVDAPRGLFDFVEVLQFGLGQYGDWYEILNLGLEVAATAGTDYPCPPAGLPGSQRFYVQVDGPLSFERWLDGLRAGRTFVTTGPMLEFSVEGIGIGGELVLSEPGLVRVDGVVRFDPTRDDIERVELVHNGEIELIPITNVSRGQIRIEAEVFVEQSGWFALRVSGAKPGSGPIGPSSFVPMSLAHTSAIFVVVDGSLPIQLQPPGLAAASRARQQLDELERQLSDDAIAALDPRSEWRLGVTAEQLLRDRQQVSDRIQRARDAYNDLLGE